MEITVQQIEVIHPDIRRVQPVVPDYLCREIFVVVIKTFLYGNGIGHVQVVNHNESHLHSRMEFDNGAVDDGGQYEEDREKDEGFFVFEYETF